MRGYSPGGEQDLFGVPEEDAVEDHGRAEVGRQAVLGHAGHVTGTLDGNTDCCEDTAIVKQTRKLLWSRPDLTMYHPSRPWNPSRPPISITLFFSVGVSIPFIQNAAAGM